nr:hypothetical protein [Tanacetum cinerariifolium]
MWILSTNLIFAFPCKFKSSFNVPSYFDYKNTTLFQLLHSRSINSTCSSIKLSLSSSRNVESTVDITELFRKLKFICHWANPFKDFEWSNAPRVKLSLFSESNDNFASLQALSNLNYLFSGFMDYFWSCKLNISNFGPANRDEMCRFGKEIDDDPDCVMFI